MPSILLRNASSAVIAAAMLAGVARPILAADAGEAGATEVTVAASEGRSRFVALGVGKSLVIDLPRDARDVLVADPKVANAVIRSARRVYLIGVAVGQTNVFFFDSEGRQIAGFDIAVTRDLNGVRAALRQVLPDADIRIEGVGDGVMLAGTASSPADAQRAFEIASRLVGDATKVVNGISVKGRDQIMLKVTVAEVQRDVIKQLGVDLNGSLGHGTAVVNFNNTNPFSATGQALSSSAITAGFRSVNATIRAMERAGVVRTLAEPTLTAISGESANFLAGGEFPVLGTVTCDTSSQPPTCTRGVEYKKFGVTLNFTPVVLSEGRISLKVLTEVSELSSEGAVTVGQGTSQQATIPSLRVRRAETTVEIPSGGALAMAGMIQEQTRQQINGLPGLMQVPVLGALFKSRDYINRQSEMMVLVTPYIVRAVAQKDLSRPDDGFADPTDQATILLGRLNRIYGVANRKTPKATYHGKYGFILD